MTKCKLLLMLLLPMIVCWSNLWGQTGITIVRQNISIQSALYQVEKQSGYSVGYDESNLDAKKQINLTIRNASLKSALDAILAGTMCSYTIHDKHIVITKRTQTDASTSTSSRTIKGKVTDQNNSPLVGATIIIDGRSGGTTSSTDGSFSIACDGSNPVLIVSYLGYATNRLNVGTADKVTIRLAEDSKHLDDIVVVGYNSVRKKDITTAVSIVSTSDINERPMVSAAQAIQGKAAGVQVVQPSGAPGASMSIRVRGATSIEAGNEPLYVVDGIPTTTITNLSPNDIETMQILKDASSAAIYGARAANGVVLITTKRGKAGARKISVSSYAGFSRLGKKIGALNTEQYKDYIKDLNKYTDVPVNIPDEETRYTNWTDKFYGTGVNQSYQVSLSSGTEKLQYFVSAGYMDEQGIVSKANFDRYNFRANIDNQTTKWLKMGVNLAYTKSSGRSVYESRSAMRAGSILSVINTPPYMQQWDSENPGQYDEFAYGSRILSPLAANAADQTFDRSRIVGSLNLDFTIYKELHFKTHFGIDQTNSNSLFYLDPHSNSDGRATKGRVEEGNSKDFEWLSENLLTYDKKFNGKHNLSLLGGMTMQRAHSNAGNMAGYDLLDSYNLRSFSAANIIDPDATYTSASQWSLASFIARVAYDYNSKYLITANMRVDGSSKFAPGNRWGTFPSVSAGWRISSEPFMESTKNVIDDLKLRVGWGMNGNQEGIGNYSWRAQYGAGRVLPSTSNLLPGLSLALNSPGNRELTWETTTQYNLGIDLSMFDGRLILAADAYYKKTKDMLLTVYLPSYMNIPAGIVRNDAAMTNKGLEFAISSRNLKDRFKWNTDFNISFNENKVSTLGLNKVYYYASMYETKQPAIVLREQMSLGTFFGYVSEGIDPETGDVMYQDRNKNGILDPDDRTIIGNAQPDFVFGLTNTFSYAGFDLSVFFQGSYGNDIFNASKIDMTSMMDFRNQSKEVLGRWKRPGMITDVPRPGNIRNIHNSTRFVEDGSYLRLKSLTLSYNFGSHGFLKKIGISKLQPYVTAQNLWTWTSYSGYDPEVNAYGSSAVELGVDYGTYPQSKAVIFGLNIEF